MNEDSKEILKTIVETAENLKSFNFYEHVKKVGLGFHASRDNNNNWIIEFGQPDDKELQAFLFKFRLFIQYNEPISFYNLNRLFADQDLSEEWKIGVSDVIQTYKKYCAEYPVYIEDLFGERPTNGEILDTVLYGGLGHTGLNPSYKHKREKFQEWTRDEFSANILNQAFTRIVLVVFAQIIRVSYLSQAELKKEVP